MNVKTALGFGGKMEFSAEETRSRNLQKLEMSSRVEEFYNACHAKSSGRFCKGKEAASSYIKEKAETTKETLEGRKGSENVKNVTIGFGRNVGSVRLARLNKADLKTFSSVDLKIVKKQLGVDQKHFNIVRNIGLATAALNIATGLEPTPFKVARFANSATMIGIATYKTNRIPGHVDRINQELRSRGELSSLDIITFAAELSVQQEIDKAMKSIQSGKVGKITSRPTASQIADLEEFIDALEPDFEEGITKKMISDMKSGLKYFKQVIK